MITTLIFPCEPAEKFADRQAYTIEPLYSQIWGCLRENYGQPINKDGNGSCFRGPKGATAVLVDNSQGYDELVLINVSLEITSELEKIIQGAEKSLK